MAADAQPALKDMFDAARFRHISGLLSKVHRRFDRKRFLAIATAGLDDLSLTQRVRRASDACRATLPEKYSDALEILKQIAPGIPRGFVGIFLPDFVAVHGRDHFEESMAALKFFTPFSSAEFAIREFLKRDLTRTLRVMETWSLDPDEHVRRLASEGSRPRLPWSFRLEAIVRNPALTETILENLKADPSLYVRKSVANHLNDITKDHPAWVFHRIADWPKDDPCTAWIMKQALRTLIKKGDTRALHFFGAGHKPEVTVDSFSVTPSSLKLGGAVKISANLVSTASSPQKLVIDYAVHYVKKAGGTSKKVFKWKELTLGAGERCDLAINRAIRDFTTRVHYAGRHPVELIVNGEVLAEDAFELTT